VSVVVAESISAATPCPLFVGLTTVLESSASRHEISLVDEGTRRSRQHPDRTLL